jgi:hypothetical protein
MTPTALSSGMIPESTKPIVSIVIAVPLCTRPVRKIPVKNEAHLFF